MKAMLCKQFGPPDSLVLADIDEPQPAAHEVCIRVRACGVNFPDVLMVAGQYQTQPPMPFVPGLEVSGEVVSVGARVSHLQPGQRVLAMCGCGGMAERVCVQAGAVALIPDSMDFVTAAGFILTYGTAWHALKQRAALQAGETVLVLGAAGGVGLAAVELAHRQGATVIAAASSAAKLELCETRGACHLLNYADEVLRDRVLDITAGRGADVILDPVGGDLFDQCLRAVAWGGRILVVGFTGGRIQKIPANLTLLKGSAVVGVFWGRFTEEEPEANRRNTRELLQFFEAGEVHPHVSETFPLQDAGKAIDSLLQRRVMGKAIVKIE